jgi:FkbM family methyltransferase
MQPALFQFLADMSLRYSSLPLSRGGWRLIDWLQKHQPDQMVPLTVVRDGLRWECDLGFGSYDRDIFYRGVYEHETIALIGGLVASGDIVVDVGANIGYIAANMARMVGPSGRVYAFEPASRFFTRLQQSMRLNGFTERVVTEQLALSDRTDRVTLNVGATTASTVMEGREFDQDLERIQTTTLDEYFARTRGPGRPIRLIKIDVDGSEDRVLRGAENVLREMQPALVVEVCPYVLEQAGESIDTFIQLVKRLGYDEFTIPGSPGRIGADAVIRRARQCNSNTFDFFNLACHPTRRSNRNEST